MKIHDRYIRRCFDLSQMAGGYPSPNPRVGSVLVHENKIIGEGLHEKYGQAHAEVNCLNSIKKEDKYRIPDSILYVSLEPCCIYGNTPPCTDLIIKNKIRKVGIPNIDSTPAVSGNGVKILEKNNCEVIFTQDKKGKELFRIRDNFVQKKRPYIFLKYALSKDGFMGKPRQNIWLTNPVSKRLVHKWRSEIGAILVGTNTAKTDNPALTNRFYFGKQPLRIVIDRTLQLTKASQLLDQTMPTLIVTEKFKKDEQNISYLTTSFDARFLNAILDFLYLNKIDSIMVEGGPTLLNYFIEQDLWNEARIFVTDQNLGSGLSGPKLTFQQNKFYQIGNDKLYVVRNK